MQQIFKLIISEIIPVFCCEIPSFFVPYVTTDLNTVDTFPHEAITIVWNNNKMHSYIVWVKKSYKNEAQK